MRKTLYLILFNLFLCHVVFAQTWKRMQSWGLDFESIHWVNATKGFVGGENLLIKTEDAGLTWVEVSIPMLERINSIHFYDETICIAVGKNGLVLSTSDGGETWNKQDFPNSISLEEAYFSALNSLFVIGENGSIYKSTDQGKTWNKITSPVNTDLYDLHFPSESKGYIAGENGVILRSEDAGQSWSKLNSNSNFNLNTISFASEEVGYAAGNQGTILKTMDSGESWSVLISGVTTDLQDITINPRDNRIVIAVGKEATSIKSTNSGASFSKANLGAGNLRTVKALNFLPETNQVVAVGQDGYLISSTNAGTSYSTRLAGVRADFTSTDFKSDRTGYIAGQGGKVFLTSNGASTLVNRPLPENMDIISMDFWNTSFGYTSGRDGKMYRSSNSGSSWVAVPAQTSESITGFYLFAPSVAYITGTNGYIARSFDSGGTWDSNIQTNTSENLKDVTYFDFQIGFAIGENGQISWTNGGNVWETLPKLTDFDLNALAKLDSNSAVIVGDKGVILKSEDKAKTWRLIQTDYQENLNSVDFWDENLGIIVGENGFTLQTKDGGETWFRIESGTTRNLFGVSMGNPLVAFAVGEEGTILNYTCVTPSGVSEITGESNVCMGASMYSIVDNPSPGSAIVWRVDGGIITSGQGTPTIQVTWTTSGRQAVFVSRQNFCGNGETSALEVNVKTKPTNNHEILGQGISCTNQTETYKVEDPNSSIFTWSISGGKIISGQGSSEVTVLWETAGSNLVSVVLENECGKTPEITKTITIGAPPAQPSTITGENLVGLVEKTYLVENIPDVNYQWSISGNGGRIVSGQGTNQVNVEWLLEGDFVLKVTPQNDCNEGTSRELPVNVNIITGLEPVVDPSLKVFPNPSNGSFSIISENLSDYTQVSIINAFGQEIISQGILEGQSELYFQDLPRGVLILKLRNQKKIYTKKLIVN